MQALLMKEVCYLRSGSGLYRTKRNTYAPGQAAPSRPRPRPALALESTLHHPFRSFYFYSPRPRESRVLRKAVALDPSSLGSAAFSRSFMKPLPSSFLFPANDFP